jgi:hypothetical protein
MFLQPQGFSHPIHCSKGALLVITFKMDGSDT